MVGTDLSLALMFTYLYRNTLYELVGESVYVVYMQASASAKFDLLLKITTLFAIFCRILYTIQLNIH